MADDRPQNLGFKHHAKVQSFRLFTVVLAWVLIAAAFYYRPDLIKQALRASTRAIESVGDAIPSPWGDRIEIMLREIGGFYLAADHSVHRRFAFDFLGLCGVVATGSALKASQHALHSISKGVVDLTRHLTERRSRPL